jgi:hypothetical protein
MEVGGQLQAPYALPQIDNAPAEWTQKRPGICDEETHLFLRQERIPVPRSVTS